MPSLHRKPGSMVIAFIWSLISLALVETAVAVTATTVAAATPTKTTTAPSSAASSSSPQSQVCAGISDLLFSSPSARTVAHLRGGQQELTKLQMAQASLQSALQYASAMFDKYPIWKDRILPYVQLAMYTTMTAVHDLTPAQRVLVVVAFLIGLWLGGLEPFWRSYRSISDVPSKRFGTVLAGRAASITDGDTIRLYHTPLPWQRVPKQISLTSQTIPIRLCTIDAPETAKFGKPGQPFGPEAKMALQNMLGHSKVYVRLLRKDQYGRAVGQVWIKGWRGQRIHMDAYMLRKGLAEVYQGQGAVYGPEGKAMYLYMEQQARRKRVGIWGMPNRETAAEYKRRVKGEGDDATGGDDRNR